MRKLKLCPMCYGTGKRVSGTKPSGFKICHTCKGTGRVWEVTTYEPYVPEICNDGDEDDIS